MNKVMKDKLKDSLQGILPVAAIIFIISLFFYFTDKNIQGEDLFQFGIGTLLLIVGFIIFNIGAENSMMAISEKIGGYLAKRKSLTLLIAIAFIIGFLITVAEPDLWVLAEQFTAVKPFVLIVVVAFGVGIFLVLALLRIAFKIKMSTLLIVSYGVVFLVAIFIDSSFVQVAFDSGGVTTGPITVPFILALGYGLSVGRGDREADENSFGLVGICSISPILAVSVLALFSKPDAIHTSEIAGFGSYLLRYLFEILVAISPFVVFFALFQIFVFKLNKKKVIKILIGFLLTYIGLVLFLVGANYGYLPIGDKLGREIALSEHNWVLIIVGMFFGFTIVVAEPAVTVLTHQVENVTSGAIPRKVMNFSLSVGVAVAVGLACLRILYEISIWWIIVPGYLLALVITLFVPGIFTSIAFDSGGSASGAMTATFLVPFAIGAARALEHDELKYAFGLVAFVALAPLLTIQILGLIYKLKGKKARRDKEEDEIIDLKEV